MVVLEFFQEFWIPVINYEGYYECSTEGRIRSVDRYSKSKIGRVRLEKGQILTPTLNTHEYPCVYLYKNGKRKNIPTHIVSFYSFNRDIPQIKGRKNHVDHLDNDKRNSKPSNLALKTARQNLAKRSMQKFKSSIYTGVSFHKRLKKWQSSFYQNGNATHLGTFVNEIDASNAYQNKLKEITSNKLTTTI